MRSIWSGSISFGLVNIPISLYSATQKHSLGFHLLRKGDLCPIAYSRICRADGKEVPQEDIVKGYEYKEGDYVILEDDDFEKANPKKTQTIEICEFVNVAEVNPIFFNKPYYLEPQKSGKKAYALLRQALKETNTVAVGEFVLRSRESLAIIKAYGDILLLNQLRYQDDIRDTTELQLPSSDLFTSEEMDASLKLINKLTKKFKPEHYEDAYIKDLKAIIEAKAKGRQARKPKQSKKEAPEKVTDMMDLLKKSLSKAS